MLRTYTAAIFFVLNGLITIGYLRKATYVRLGARRYCLEPYLFVSFLNSSESHPSLCLRVALAFHRLLFQVEHQRESGEPWWRQREPERRLGTA
jgi:hypothetical protein